MDSNGGTVKNVEPILLRRPISSKTSALIRQYLYATMYGPQDANGNNATGRAARIAGYAMGGKTGTAEKIPRDKTNYLVSFIGFAPADSPQVVLYVVVDEPNALNFKSLLMLHVMRAFVLIKALVSRSSISKRPNAGFYLP